MRTEIHKYIPDLPELQINDELVPPIEKIFTPSIPKTGWRATIYVWNNGSRAVIWVIHDEIIEYYIRTPNRKPYKTDCKIKIYNQDGTVAYTIEEGGYYKQPTFSFDTKLAVEKALKHRPAYWIEKVRKEIGK